MKLYIGYDVVEDEAYRVAEQSARAHGCKHIEPLNEDKLRAQGLFTRMVDKRGQKYDLPSNAPCSTDFATSRFLTPILCQTGWAMFTDCDVVFHVNPEEILEVANPHYAVMVVKHYHHATGKKMVNMAQVPYVRKNWSSVMLFNCDHPSNRRLSLWDVNNRPGRDLHQFYWLNDHEIGELDQGWNWLVNEQKPPASAKISHYTNGGPWLEGWQGAEHDDEWIAARDKYLVNG